MSNARTAATSVLALCVSAYGCPTQRYCGSTPLVPVRVNGAARRRRPSFALASSADGAICTGIVVTACLTPHRFRARSDSEQLTSLYSKYVSVIWHSHMCPFVFCFEEQASRRLVSLVLLTIGSNQAMHASCFPTTDMMIAAWTHKSSKHVVRTLFVYTLLNLCATGLLRIPHNHGHRSDAASFPVLYAIL